MTSMIHRSPLRSKLALTTALAGMVVALPGVVQAQTFADIGTVDSTPNSTGGLGNPDFATPDADTLRVRLNAENTIINWADFNVPAGKTVDFQNNPLNILGIDLGVINRVVDGPSTNISTIAGTITSDPNISVWVINTNGIMIGNGANISTGSFIGSTLNLSDDNDFLDGDAAIRFAGPVTADAMLTVNGATIRTMDGNRALVLVAPRIDANGTFDTFYDAPGPGGERQQDIAFVTATDATVTFDSGSPLAVMINAGTAVAGATQIVGGTVSGRNVYFALASQAAVTDALLSIDAVVTATSAAATDNGIVLAGGAASAPITLGGGDVAGVVDVTANGSLTATGAGGDIALEANGDIAGTATASASQGFVAAGQAVGLGAITAGDVAQIDANGVFTAISISGDDGVEITQAGAFASTVSGAVTSSAGGFTADGGTAMEFGSIDVDGGINIGGTTAPTSLIVNGTTETGGSLTVRTTDAQTYTGAVTAAGAVDIANTVAGNITLTGGLSSSGSTVDIEAIGELIGTGAISGSDMVTLEGATMSLGNVTSVNDAIVLTTMSGALSVGNLTADTDITVASAGGASLNGNVDAGDDLAVTGTTVALGDATADEIRANGTIVVQSSVGAVTGSAGLVQSALAGGAGNFLIIDAATSIGLGGTALNAGVSQVGLDAGAGSAIVMGDITAALLGNANGIGVDPVFSHDADTTFGDLNITAQALAVTLSAGNLVTGDISSIDTSLLAISAGQTITAGNIDASAGIVSVQAGGAVVLGNVDASASAVLQGATLSSGSVAGGIGGVGLTATAGNLSAGEITSGANAIVTANAGTATLADAATIAGDFIVSAGTVNLGVDVGVETQQADGSVSITALTGAITGGAGLTLQSGTGPLTLDSNAISFDASSTLRGGAMGAESDVQIRSATLAGGVTLGDVEARGLLGLVGVGVFTNGITRDSSITVDDVTLVNTLALTSILGDVTVGGATVTGVGQGIDLSAAGALTAPGSFAASGSISLVGSNSLTVGSLDSATGSIFVQSTSGGVTANGLLEGTSVTVRALGGDAASNAAVNGAVNAQAGNYLVTGNAVTLGAGVVQQATGLIDIISTGGGISGGAGLALRSDSGGVGGGALYIDSAGAVSLAGSTLQAGTAGTSDFAVHAASGQTVVLGDITAARFGQVSIDHITFSNTFLHNAAVTVGDATINGSDFWLGTFGGNLTTGNVSATAIQVVTLAGAVTGGNYSATISATVNGTTIDLTSLTTTTGVLNATANGGDLRIGTVSSGGAATLSTIAPGAGDIFVDSATAAGLLTVNSVGDIAGDTGARASLTSTGGSIDVDAVGAATLGTVGASQNIDIRAASIDVTSLDATNGSLTLNATGTGLALGNVTGQTGVTLTSLGDLSVTSATSSAGTVSLTSTGGNTTLGDATAAGNVGVTAALAASVTGNVTAGGAYSVTGGSVNLGVDGDAEVQQAAGTVTIRATGGALTGGTGLTLRSDSSGGEGELLTLGLGAGSSLAFGNAAIEGGAGRTSVIRVEAIDAAPALVFGNVSGRTFSSAIGAGGFSNALRTDGGATTGDLDFSAELVVLGNGPVIIGAVNSGSFSTLDSGTGALTVGGPVTIVQEFTAYGGSISFASGVQAGDSVYMQSAGAITGTSVNAGTSVSINGGSVDFASIANTAGALNATATVGDLSVGIANIGGSVSLSSAGNATLDTLTAAGNIGVTAALAATITGNVTAGGAYAVSGGSVALGVDGDAEVQRAAGAVTITANGGPLTGGTGLMLRSNGDDVGAELLTLSLGAGASLAFGAAEIEGGANRSSRIRIQAIDPAPTLVFGDVSGLTFQSNITGSLDSTNALFTGGSVTTGNLDFSAELGIFGTGVTTGSVNSDSYSELNAGSGALIVNGPVTIANQFVAYGGSISFAGSVTGGDLIQMSAAGAISGTTVGAATGLAISGGSVDFTSLDTAAGALNATAAAGDLSVGTAEGGTVTLSTTGGAGDVRVDSATAAGLLTINSVDQVRGDGVARANLTSTGGAVAVTATGAVNLGTGLAATNLSVTGSAIDATSLTATGGALTLMAGAAGITLDSGTGSTATLSTTGAATIASGLNTMGNSSVSAASAVLAPIVSTAGSVSVTTTGGDYTGFGGGRADVTAGTGITLAIAGNALIGTLDAGGAISATAASLDATTIDAVGAAATTSTGATVVGTILGSSITSTGGSIAIGTATSGGLLDLSATAGGLTLATGAAAGLADIDATGAVLIGTLTADSALIDAGTTLDATVLDVTGALTTISAGATTIATIDAATADITGGSIDVTDVTTAGALDMTATAGDLVIGTGTSGGQMTLAASNDILFTTLDSGADASLTAGGDILGNMLSAVGAVSTIAGGLTDIATLDATGIAITSAVIDIASISTPGSLALTSTTGDLTLGTGGAGTSATLSSAANLFVTTSLTAGGLASATAVGNATIGAITSTGGDVVLTAAAVDIDTASANGLLDASATGGDLLIGTGTAGGLADLDATGAIDMGTLAAGSATVDAGGALDAMLLDVTGAVATTSAGATTIATIDAGSATVTGQTVDVTTATTAGALALTSTGGLLRLDTGAVGGAATLAATGPLTITTSLISAGDASAVATGAATIGQIRSTAGSVTARGTAATIAQAQAATALDLDATAGALALTTGSSGGNATLDASGAITLGGLTSGGTAALAAGGALDATSVSATGAATTQSTGATTIGTLAGSSVASTGASVTIGTATAGTTLAVTASAGDATVNGTAGTTATISASRDVLIGTGLTAGGATTITAGRDARLAQVTATAGALTVTATNGQVSGATAGTRVNLTAGGAGNALTVTAGDTALLGTANGAGGVTVNAGAIDATSVGASGGAISLTASAGGVTLGTGTASGNAGLTATGAVGVGSLSAANIAINGASATTTTLSSTGSTAVTATGAATLGTTTAGSSVAVTANGVTAGTTSAGTTLSLTSGGGITLASGTAGGNATFDAAGTASLGAVTAGASSTLRVRATDAAINGLQRAGTIELVNHTPSATMRLGDGTAAGGFALSNTELALMEANTLTLDGGSGAIEIGTLTFDADAGRTAVNVLTTGQIDIGSTISGTGTGRLFRFGGDASANAQASAIRILTTSDAGGRLLFGTSDVELRGQRIVMGLATGFLDTILGSTPLSPEAVAAQFISNPNSALYNPAITGQLYTNKDIVVANSLTVRFSDYALFQNTEAAGLNGGVVLGGTPATPVTPALTIDGANSAGADGFALFGTINGVSGSAASLLGPSVIVVNMVDLPNARVNGCLIGSGAGCLTSVVVQPTLNVFDSSRLDVLRAADDLSLPFDPVVGSNNEALFSGVSSIDAPVTGDECEANPDAPECKASEEETVQ